MPVTIMADNPFNELKKRRDEGKVLMAMISGIEYNCVKL